MILRLILTTVLWAVAGSRVPGTHTVVGEWLICGAVVLFVEGCWRVLLARVARPQYRVRRSRPSYWSRDEHDVYGAPYPGPRWGAPQGSPDLPPPEAPAVVRRQPRVGEPPHHY